MFISNATVNLDHLTLSGGRVTGFIGGGGMLVVGSTVTLTNSTVSGNRVGDIFNTEVNGGGVYALGSTVTLTNSTVSINYAFFGGGGVGANGSTVRLTNSTISGNRAIGGSGGGVFVEGGSVTLTDSTVSGNEAVSDGGGVYARNSSLTLTNSTVSGNTAMDYGGGASVGNGSVAILTNSTVSGNGAGDAGGGVAAGNDSTVTLINSIIASSYGDDCLATLPPTITDSIIEDGSCGATLTGDPMLGPLADNGGPTQTHALLSGSPAIRSGGVGGETDQRGFVALDARDLGAYEFNGVDPNSFDPVTLNHNRWTMVGLSKNNPSKTVADVFATTTPTALASADYNSTWVVYRRDESTDSYVLLALTDTLEQGKGYWVLQITGSDLEFAPDGADTPVDMANSNCPSTLGCFVIDLVEGDGKDNFIAHPFTADIKWQDIRVTVDGVLECDYSHVLDTFWNYNGSNYDSFSTTIPIPDGGVFEAYKGYWVQTLAPSIGTDVKLLIPSGEASDACTEPPAMTSVDMPAEGQVAATAVSGDPSTRYHSVGMTGTVSSAPLLSFRANNSESRNLHGPAADSSEESALTDARAVVGRSLHSLSLGRDDRLEWAQDDSALLSLREAQRRSNPDALPWWLSWISVAEAAEDTTLKRGEWWVRLQAESAEDGGMVDQYNYLGWYKDSEDGKDRRDLIELPPFGSPYLTIVFRHDDWVANQGDYSTDLRKRKHWRKGEEWDFIVKSDKAGREVTLSWEGYNNHKRFGRMRLVDVETGETVKTVRRKQLQTYTFTTRGTEHRFKWVYLARPKK